MKFKIIRSPIILTRYLYIKEEVMASLFLSILEKNKEEALFWAYELYYSGFQTETFDYLLTIYSECFAEDNPRLRKYMEGQKSDNPCAVGNIVLNLTDSTRKYNLEYFEARSKPPSSSPKKDPKFYIQMNEGDVEKYNAIETGDDLPRKVLKRACRYRIRTNYNATLGVTHLNVEREELKRMLFGSWLYYASFSPIWKDRIVLHEGSICHESKRVVFGNDDFGEEFYDKFGYEPDEQGWDVLSNILGECSSPLPLCA